MTPLASVVLRIELRVSGSANCKAQASRSGVCRAGVGNFAVEFAFRHPQMTHYSVVANDRDCEVWKIKRLESRAMIRSAPES